MRISTKVAVAAAAIAVATASPALARPDRWQQAETTREVDLRAGPAPDYRVVIRLHGGSQVQLFGCLSGWSWCDVAWSGVRGWMPGAALRASYQGRSGPVPEVGGVPFVGFDVDSYWYDHYRNRPWYGHRPPPSSGGYYPPSDSQGATPSSPPAQGGHPRPPKPRPPYWQRNGVPMQGGVAPRPSPDQQ